MFLNVYFDVFGIVFLLKHHPDDCFNGGEFTWSC